jgi:hypothetical protein
MILRTGLAVVLAGVAGCLANAAFAGLFVNAALWQLALAPGRYGFSVLFAALLPPIYRLLPGAWGAALALALLTLLPAWAVVLALNFVYALTALLIYRLVLGPR